jgi:sulfate transport system ATP-binding protein
MSVAVEGVTKRFGTDAAAVDGVDLTAADGEFLALLGPSGSGKTTLLRLIAGLDRPDAGRILIAGADMADVPARERRIGFVFQHFALFRHMSVAENIAFGLRVRPRATRPSKAAIRARVAELLDLVQMPQFGARYPDQLSGGQRQRVALARALAIEPRVLLLDEPFGALDARVRRDLRRWLRGMHDRLGLTTVMVTHDQTEALDLADRVAVLRAGKLEQVDRPATLWAQPASAFVYDFIGEAVRFPCEIEGGTARFAPLAIGGVATDLADGPAEAVIRPHEIALRPGDGAGRILSVARAGPLLHAEVAIGERIIPVFRPDDESLPVGAACEVDLGRARFYARAMGSRG